MHEQGLGIRPASTEDYRLLAKKKLPRQFFDYIDGGSYRENTARDNVSSLANIQLKQKVLTDVANVNTQTSLFGETLAMPVILAPVGLAGCFAKRGEVQAHKAATSAQIPFCLSTVGICPIEELQQQVQSSFWFQLYVIKDRAFSLELLSRAQKAGCNTLVFTVDLPVLGERYRDTRNGLGGGAGAIGNLKRLWDLISHPKWLFDVPISGKPLVFGNLASAVPNASALGDFVTWVDSQFDASITWQDLAWLREHWSGNIVIKGILDKDDAEKAIEFGADGIVVSNHGGRQLDDVPATISVLPDIVKQVNGRASVIVDGGIRSGLDVVKAVALGADACMIGRAWAYALAAQGEQGVSDLLQTFNAEIKIAMALTGVTSISQLSKEILI